MDAPGHSPFPNLPETEEAHRIGALERSTAANHKLLQVILGVLVLILVMQGTGAYQQILWLRNQAVQLSHTANELGKALGDYETNTLPAFNRLYTDLNRYAQSHPDYARLFARYRMETDEPQGSNAPAPAAPAPAR